HFADEVLARAKKIPPDATPQWGKMTRSQMFGHLTDVLHYTMGRRGEMPDKSTWVTRNILRRLIFSGLVKIPKNVKLPRKPGKPAPHISEGDLETLEATMSEYLVKAPVGELDPPRHPFFGNLGIDGW